MNISGGIGNQMFQYAMSYSLSKSRGVPLKFDLTAYAKTKIHDGYVLDKVFDIQNSEAELLDYAKVLGLIVPALPLIRRGRPHIASKKIIREKSVFVYDHRLLESIEEKAYINGYWQAPKYFLDYENDIRAAFSFDFNKLTSTAKDMFWRLKQTNSVAIHVRRGDYIKNSTYKNLYAECSEKYYDNAISLIRSRVSSPNFYVFSDDPEWIASQSIFEGTTIASNPEHQSWEEMFLMSSCSHNIIANSTYSWWGAWLNNKPTTLKIAPIAWFKNDLQVTDLIADDWIII